MISARANPEAGGEAALANDSGSEMVKQKGTLLLVDDDRAVRDSLGRALQSEDYRVLTVSDGVAALGALEHNHVDLVLLDLSLPVMSGWNVFEKITAVRPTLPIIIITARPDQYQSAAAAGASAIMEKPLALPVLIRAIDSLMQESNNERAQRILARRPMLFNAHNSTEPARS